MNKKMKELKNRQDKIHKDRSKPPKSVKTHTPAIPVYDLKGRNRNPKTMKRKKRICITVITAGLVFGFIYVPQYFIKDGTNIPDTTFVTLDRDAARTVNTLLRSDGDSDYDGDGVSNSDESDFGTSPYLIDTDGDHATDYAEKYVTQTDPTKATTVMIDYQTKQDSEKGKKVTSPYSINEVILYPSDYESRTYGGVVELSRNKTGLTGAYRFTGFKGYVQFPVEGTAYKYEDGIHTPLTHDEQNDVWYIDGDCVVEVYSSPLKEMEKLTVFGNTFYLESGGVLDVLDRILPDKGFITMSSIVEIDTYADTSKTVQNTVTKPVYDTSDTDRFKNNTNSLNDLLFVRSIIDDGGCVAVSLFSEDDGEYIGIIYGYDAEGNLLVADSDTLKDTGKLYIREQTVKMLDEMGDIVPVSSFTWSGLGLSSNNGYKISFFAVAENKAATLEKPVMKSDLKSTDTESTAKSESTTEESSTKSESTVDSKDAEGESADSSATTEKKKSKKNKSKASDTASETSEKSADKTTDKS